MFNNEIDFQLYPQLCIQSKTISRELQCRDSNQANIRSMPFIVISNSKRENEMKGLVRRCNEEVVVYREGPVVILFVVGPKLTTVLVVAYQ